MISGVFGLCGSGKSVFLAKCVYYALKGKAFSCGGVPIHYGKYSHILTNFYCSGCEIFNFNDLGKFNFENCLFLCDEISLLADSRNFKSFSSDAKFFFSQHRKGGNDFIWCSQNYDDVDKRIRSLTDGYFYIRPSRFFPDKFSTVIPIVSQFSIFNGIPTTNYVFSSKKSCIYLPKYWNLIDSYSYINSKTLAEPAFSQWDLKTISN